MRQRAPWVQRARLTLALRERTAAERAARRREPNPRESLITFGDIVSGGRFHWYRHAELLADVLERVAADELKRVMIFMPPRHSKSETVSRLFSAYYLRRFPDRWVGVNSYAAELAHGLSRNARENYRRSGGPISDTSSAAGHWETGEGGGFWAAGVGGPITGKGFHLGIIDDPLKNLEEAQSATIREKQREWYLSTFKTRSEPGAAIILIMTRWHPDDLAGWLLSQETEGEHPEHWHVVSLPAIAEDPRVRAHSDGRPEFPSTCTVEPDWRAPGEALCPERYSAEYLSAEISRSPWIGAALYQQRPRPKEGGFFKREWFEIVDFPPAIGERVRAWDRAATDGGGDWTAGVRMCRTPEGLYFVEDVQRFQLSPGRRDPLIRQTAQLDTRAVSIFGEQEPGAAGKSDALAFAKLLDGFTVHTEPSTGDKTVRAGPFASAAEGQRVKLVRGPWNRDFLDELCDFPKGVHDDQVDAAAAAYNQLALDTSLTPYISRSYVTV